MKLSLTSHVDYTKINEDQIRQIIGMLLGMVENKFGNIGLRQIGYDEEDRITYQASFDNNKWRFDFTDHGIMANQVVLNGKRLAYGAVVNLYNTMVVYKTLELWGVITYKFDNP